MFEKIVGHEKQKIVLENSLKAGSISHAYLFSGKKGIGKFTFAEEFSKILLGVDTLSHSPDINIISRKEDKKDIVIEQIRKEVIEDMYLAPIASDRKVYIIDDAECLNIASQNALLKTLEEPPSYVTMILVASSSNSFLATILSRVNQITFSGVENKRVKDYILQQYQKEMSDTILGYVDGSIGDAISVIEQNSIDKFNEIDKLYMKLINKDRVGAMKTAENIKFTEENMLDYLEYLLFSHSLFICTKFVEKAKIRLKYNGNYDIVIDNMILKIVDQII